MKPLAYYSKSKDYVCTPQERTLLKLYKTYTVPLIPVPKPLSDDEILDIFDYIIDANGYPTDVINLARAIEERHGIK